MAEPPAVAAVAADASYSGAPSTIPAAMLDGNASTKWSNYYLKAATALLPEVSRAHAAEWVSLTGLEGAPISTVQASFIVDTSHALPATVSVSYWNGTAFVPVRNARVEWATESGRSTRITFAPVSTSRIRLDLTSRAPGTTGGFLGIAEAAVGRLAQ
jgi:beta-galactosidase